LEGTKITDAGLVNLEPLKKLQSLSLAATPITDAALGNLVGLTNLKDLELNFTQTTAEGQQKLQESLPALKIAN
ncbi:MAG: hypothetical protein HY288_18680, partial [Planctomycetia bacterium]|nr:hypothetical protein [Planctomycetia bacterium]